MSAGAASNCSQKQSPFKTSICLQLAGSHVGRISSFADEMAQWLPILERIGCSHDDVMAIAGRARENGTVFQDEILASKLIKEDILYSAIAVDLGIVFLADLDPDNIVSRYNDIGPVLGGVSKLEDQPLVFYEATSKTGRLQLLGTGRLDLRGLRNELSLKPERRLELALTSPSRLRQALLERFSHRLTARARDTLSREAPDCSALSVISNAQGLAMCSVALLLPVCFVVWPGATLLGLHLLFSLFFLACIGLRMIAAKYAEPPYLTRLSPVSGRELPVYSVMVALHREADVVPELLASLGRLVWPRAKLEIKIVCEADDHETLEVLKAQALRPWVEIIEVPASNPRTKPKALTYALPLTRGEFVAIYDAEDKPHPLQLIEAWQNFQTASSDLACLQAPLVITNSSEGLIARLFAFEYAALFRGLLPWLAQRKLLLPLGGTSNHFRRDALEVVGGWDPYNVTEDADLGLRFLRFGYRCGTISHPTFEEAPSQLKDWLPQRTRWFKGWLQTWLVHMRHPVRLWREIGAGSFLVMQIIFAGMVGSALVHPLMLVTIFWIGFQIAGQADAGQHSLILVIDMVNIICGYTAFLVLGAATLVPREGKGLMKTVFATPLYWLLLSCAAWRAVWHLYAKPFQWEKTHHRKASSRWKKSRSSGSDE